MSAMTTVRATCSERTTGASIVKKQDIFTQSLYSSLVTESSDSATSATDLAITSSSQTALTTLIQTAIESITQPATTLVSTHAQTVLVTDPAEYSSLVDSESKTTSSTRSSTRATSATSTSTQFLTPTPTSGSEHSSSVPIVAIVVPVIVIVLIILGAIWWFVVQRRKPVQQHQQEPFEKPELDGGCTGRHSQTASISGARTTQAAFRRAELDIGLAEVPRKGIQKDGVSEQVAELRAPSPREGENTRSIRSDFDGNYGFEPMPAR